MSEYVYILCIMATVFFIGLFLIILSTFITWRKKDEEKVSPYECGFMPFSDARMKFDVKFYLVGILFVVLDLELSFLYPWLVIFGYIGIYGLIVMMLFLYLLLFGYFLEWYKGALNW